MIALSWEEIMFSPLPEMVVVNVFDHLVGFQVLSFFSLLTGLQLLIELLLGVGTRWHPLPLAILLCTRHESPYLMIGFMMILVYISMSFFD